MHHLFCFGLGFSATTLANELLDHDWRVSGTCRTTEKFPSLQPMGITPHIFAKDLPLENVWDLDSITHILHSVPPGPDGDIVFNYHLEDLKNLPNLKWFGYLSTIGVYGDHQGAWVDETTPTAPNNERSQYRVDAEQAWLDSGLPIHIFRLSGIYGPGRNAIDSVKNGTARCIDKPGQVFSRIHVEDIAQILQASITRPNPGQIYNCADDMPAPQSDVVQYAAKLIGVEPPKLVAFADADLTPMARSFYSACRRVSNKKIKDQLGVKLKYPDYKIGLDTIFN